MKPSRVGDWIATALFFAASAGAALGEALPSWNPGPARQAIEDFVRKVTDPQGAEFVPPADRVAVFDNDGTLWVEQPMYTQLAFALERVKALAPQHREWQSDPALKAATNGDFATLAASGEKGLLNLIMATHAGMSTEDFEAIVEDFLGTAKHPRFHEKYTDLVYQPMLELLDYLRENGFTTYIVSGGGIEFMRPWTEEVYGVAPPQVVGSSIKTKFEVVDGRPTLTRLPEVNFIDDGDGKPVGINEHIGQRPIAAFGNSDGDLQMLQWTTEGEGARLGMIVHHTDAEREYAYDRASHFGKLDKAMDMAPAEGWTLIDMKADWKEIFPTAK